MYNKQYNILFERGIQNETEKEENKKNKKSEGKGISSEKSWQTSNKSM